ncbi:MAG: hypothetical protein WCJ58_05040 [bacterium]
MNKIFKQKNQEYFYPLYQEKDKVAFAIVQASIEQQSLPEIAGDLKLFSEFFQLLIISGKARNWRQLMNPVIEQITNKKLLLAELLALKPELDIPEGVVSDWAIFDQDQKLCLDLDELADLNIELTGSLDEARELLKRYVLTQYLQDWRGPKMAMALELLATPRHRISHLNQVLANWDYLKLFKKS